METTFKRPPKIKIVDLCKFVDENMCKVIDETIPLGERQKLEDTLIQDIYFIVDSFAKTAKFFPRYADYDEFALYAAGEYYMIFKSKLERAGQLSRGKIVEPVKSIKNYLNFTLYAYKVLFQRQHYDSCIWPEMLSNADQFQNNLRDNIRQQYSGTFEDELKEVMDTLPQDIWKMLKNQCPYKEDDDMLQKIYVSVMLTFIKNITLPNKVKMRFDSSSSFDPDKKLKYYYKLLEDEVVLWHLPNHMEGFIQIWYRKAKRLVTDGLAINRSRMNLTDEVVDSILNTAFTTYDLDRRD